MSRRVVVAVCLLACVPSIAAAVPITDAGVSPIRTYDGVSLVTDVHVESHTLQVDGSTVYEVTVAANSSRTLDVNAAVAVSLETLDGTSVASGYNTKLIGAGGTTTYNIDVTPNVTRSEYSAINVTVMN